MTKILCIGNSFSTDATRYLESISNNTLFVRNLFIGGCSLERHTQNLSTNAYDYEYQKDGECIIENGEMKMISILEAINADDWDYVTVQQVSNNAGVLDSYEPFLGQILSFVKEKLPKAKIVFHRTWAYEIDSDHGGFATYENDQQKMFDAIMQVTERVAKKYSLPVIPVGEAIQKLRTLKEFDYKNGGLSLNRDGFHLSFDYGRYAAGLVWNKFFTNTNPKEVTFAPDNTDKNLIELIKNNL